MARPSGKRQELDRVVVPPFSVSDMEVGQKFMLEVEKHFKRAILAVLLQAYRIGKKNLTAVMIADKIDVWRPMSRKWLLKIINERFDEFKLPCGHVTFFRLGKNNKIELLKGGKVAVKESDDVKRLKHHIYHLGEWTTVREVHRRYAPTRPLRTLQNRLIKLGWTVEDAISTPTKYERQAPKDQAGDVAVSEPITKSPAILAANSVKSHDYRLEITADMLSELALDLPDEMPMVRVK